MKPSTAEKASDKAAKPASRAQAKVFDVARPGKGSPSATSRPIIVTNRPILPDPMVTASATSEMEQAEKPSPAAVKVTIKPLTASLAADESVKPEKSAKKDKTIAELAEEGAAAAGPKAGQSEKDNVESKAPEGKADEEPAETEDKPEAETKPAPKPEESEDSAETTDDADKVNDETLPTDDTKDAKETAALEAEAKKLEEINTLAESRQYFLPINAVERHRSKVISILGLLLIVTLGLMLVDLLLDVGFIRLGGIHSLTHFFSS